MDFCYQKNKMTIYPAILYVEEHYMEPIAIEVLADACCLSLTHFRRLFKVIMNETPLDYVNRIRINKSCELLYNTEDSVLSIALQVGFSGNTSYNRNFRTIMGDDTSAVEEKEPSYEQEGYGVFCISGSV